MPSITPCAFEIVMDTHVIKRKDEILMNSFALVTDVNNAFNRMLDDK